MSAMYYTIDTAYSVHTQELVTSTMQNDNNMIISTTPLVYYAIAVPAGLLAMCLGLIVLILCVYVCNQHRKYLLEHKNGDSHKQEPVYFTIEPTDHQQATGVELKQTCLSETAGESNTILIESTYDVISGCHNNMIIYENLDTANADNIIDTLPNSEVNANDNVSLPDVLDKESN